MKLKLTAARLSNLLITLLFLLLSEKATSAGNNVVCIKDTSTGAITCPPSTGTGGGNTGSTGSSKGTTKNPSLDSSAFPSDPYTPVKTGYQTKDLTYQSGYTTGIFSPAVKDNLPDLSKLPTCPSQPICPSMNDPISTNTADINKCPPLCKVDRVITTSDSGTISGYSDATCPVTYSQVSTFNPGQAIVYLNAAQMPFPIGSMALFNSYQGKGYSCTLIPSAIYRSQCIANQPAPKDNAKMDIDLTASVTLSTAPTLITGPNNSNGNVGQYTNIYNAFSNQVIGVNLQTGINFKGTLASLPIYFDVPSDVNTPCNPKMTMGETDWASSGAGYIGFKTPAPSCSVTRGDSSITYSCSGGPFLWTVPKVPGEKTHPGNIVGPLPYNLQVYYEYSLYQCTRPAGYSYSDQKVNTSAVCSHPSLQNSKNGIPVNQTNLTTQVETVTGTLPAATTTTAKPNNTSGTTKTTNTTNPATSGGLTP